MSIADSIIKGTYGNNNTVGIKYSSKKTSIADSIINGSYYETLKKRKKEKEEEQKRIAEQQKLEKEQQVKKQVENVSTYGPTTQTNKVQTVTDKLKNIAPVSNEAIKSNSQIGETQKVTRSDVKAQQKATEINQDLKNGNKASAIGAILNGIPEGIKSGVAKSINALNILGARTFDEQDKKINWMQDEILKDKPNATANRLKDMPSFANRAKNKLLDKAEDLDDRTTMHSKTVSQIENSKVKTAAGVSSSIGEMVPAMISNIIAPGSGIYASAVQNAGGSAMETLNSDRNNIDKAVRTGVLKGTASALTEKITGGNLIAKGGLDNAIGRAIKGNVKSKIGQNLLYKGYQILGEMGEEQLENEAGYVIDKVINNKDMPDLKQRWEEATETAKMTGLTTIALNLVGLGGGSIDDVELSDMSTKDKKTIKDILERAKKTGTFKEGELADLVSKTDTDNKFAPIKDLDYLESAKKNNIDTNNETVRSIARITNERGIKASYDSNAFTNTNQNALWRIKTDENGNVTREVIINPNADTNKTLQNIAIHELTHDIEGTEQYNQIKDIILKYDKTKNGFEEARKSLAETYSKMYDKNSADFNELVDNEAVADILGNKLGDQDFINNLTMQNRTLGQKIYDWVVDKFNKLNGKLGYKSEKIYWADVKNKFENAFKQEYQNTNNQTSRFSIQTTADGNKYVKVDTNQDIFEGKNINEQIKIARRYILDNFRENGINFNESNIKVTSKTANEYTHPKNKLPQSTRESKIKASTELDNLLNISEYQYSSKDDGRHSFAKDGWDYYKTVFEVNGVKFEGLINIAKDGNKKTFYDVTKIKRISQNRSTSANAFSTSLTNSNNSIAPIKDDVNTTKYSMQESEKNSDSFNLSKQDNKGRTLTKEQQEYFKDSKVRDENGNLLEVYHGTEANSGVPKEYWFTIFDIDKSKISTMGDGFYFTDNYDRASSYAHSKGNVYKSYLNITNPFTLKNNMTFEETVKRINPNYNIDNLKMENRNKFDGTKLRKYLMDNGYDGISLSGTYVAFNSNQIKNVDNTNPTNNPDIRYSIQNNSSWQEYLNKNYKNTGRGEAIKDVKLAPVKNENIQNNYNLTDDDLSVLNKIYEKEGKTEVLTKKEKAKILEKYASDKYKFGDSLDILAQKFVNKGHYIDKLSEDAKNPELKFIYDRNLNSFAEGQYVIGVAQTDNNGKKIGKSINDIWKPIEEAKLTKEFSDYLVNMHNANTSERGKYIIGRDIGPTESSAIALELEQKHPEFKKYAKEIKEFNHNNLLNLKDAGMITQDTIDYIETMYPNYIPISRNFDGNSYVGDNEKTGAAGPLKRLKGGSTDIQPLKDGLAGQAIRIKRLINQNKLGQELAKTLVNAKVDENIDVEVAPSLLFELDTLVDTDQKGNKYYTYFEDGKLQKLKINDKLYESLRPSERSKLESTLPVKALQKVTNLHRSLLTSDNPVFIATNFFKDIQDGAFNSKYSKKFLKNYGKALNEIVTKGKYYESYMANGGMSNTYFEYDTGVKKKGNKFVEKIRNANEVVEQLPRLSEFISTLEDGKSLNEALYNAAEITTNFKRGGDITKAINRNGANFLNASIQGLDKQFRNFSGKNGAKGYANLLVKATVMGVAPAVLNHMLLDDDDDYEKLPESTKDLYYLFKYGDGKFIRIPKGRVLSIFGSAARRTLETAEGEKDSWKGFKDTVVNQIAPNNPLEDNILAPVIAVKNNKTWYGGDLVSSRLQKELPKNQYDETTDNLSKWLGAKLNVSPKKINYLIDQYSGGIGDVLLPEITPQAKKNVIVDKFTTDSVLKNKNVGKFYETLEKQTQIANDSFATDEDQLQLKYLNSVSKEMGDLYKEKRKIQMSNISNKEKTAKVREIQEKINTLAEKGLSNYNTGIKTKNSYKAGGENYYKDGKGEWQKLDDDELKGGLSVDTYADYKQKVYKETQSKRESGKLTKTQSLKDKDKLEILLNSNYSSKEKTAIYENYILSSTNTTYPLLKKSGIDIDEYMKYLQQDFKSEKKDNGTTSGKTVAGSAKRKTYKYVNSMNISYEQKLLLLGTQYKLNNAERTKLYNYVKTLDYSQEEMQKVFEKLQGFTVYKDGRVTW
nr:MAG TPA: Large polyvalent protein associated domain 38 [Caudoviricetes sp.]